MVRLSANNMNMAGQEPVKVSKNNTQILGEVTTQNLHIAFVWSYTGTVGLSHDV